VVHSSICSKKTGQTTHDTRFYLSSQEPADRTPAQWQDLIRGHWAGVEIRNHWRRDSLWGEDRSRTRKAHALANLALLRSALLVLTPTHFPELPLKQVFEQLHSNPAACLRVIA
jgi:predicted transposase YbfD/YdcC